MPDVPKFRVSPTRAKRLKGTHNEHRKPGNPKFDRMLADAQRKGFRQSRDVVLNVNDEGQVHVANGNTHLAVARAMGVPALNARVTGDGEAAEKLAAKYGVEGYAKGGPVVKAYTPSLRERAQIGGEKLFQKVTGREPGYWDRQQIEKLSGLLDFVPIVGDTLGVDETKRALDRKQWIEAALTGAGTAVGAVPVVGDVAGGALRAGAKAAERAVAKAGEKLAAKYGPDVALLPSTFSGGPIRAYHGSPHNFERFDMSKLRTGEGNNVYGEGLYFAEHPDVARSYRETLAGPASTGSVRFRNRPILTRGGAGAEWGFGLPNTDIMPRDVAADLLRKYGDVGATIEDYRNFARQTREDWAPGNVAPGVGSNVSASGRERLRELSLGDADLHDRMADFLERHGADFRVRAPGHTYEVAIKADPSQFLDWEQPLAEQSPLVRSALIDFAAQKAEKQNAARREMLAKGADFRGRPFTPERRASLEEVADPERYSGAALYSMLGIDAGALQRGEKDPEVRQRLLDLGVLGNKYLDRGSRSGAGYNTRNYVVFDDSLIDILNKYAKGGAVELDDLRAKYGG